MLTALSIRDMLLIDRLDLDFRPGLNVLTGETGAGKSILLDSLGFVLGWRGRADLVRSGAEKGEVTAEFTLDDDHPARAILREADLPDDDMLLLRRVNAGGGRKTAYVNDRRVSGETLRALSAVLVELHGQQDDRGLLDPRQHRALLDRFGGLDGDLAETRAAWRARQTARKALTEAETRLAAAEADRDFLTHAVEELTKLSPEAGEDASLDTRRRQLQAAGKIADDLAKAASLVEEGAERNLFDALRWIEDAARHAPQLDEVADALNRAITEIGEAGRALDDQRRDLMADPAELERVEERLFAIRALARKHDVLADDLATLADDLSRRLAQIEGGASEIKSLEAALVEADLAYDGAAKALSEGRSRAAKALDKAMAKELPPLKMERAVFTTEVARGEPGPEGRDDVAFVVATNPGAPAGPLAKIASGGELSRFLLALKVCLTGDDSGITMIFDEIDRGVGGATADAVGRRLKALANGGQVLVVTHSPQVAALGANHWRVAKSVEDGATLSRVTPLDEAARVDEIARMLSGDAVTDAARDAATALLDGPRDG
ncbi:DNA repair protein RecN [Paracoccaceae bacterium GXU_MW_L88]